jgi:arylformamidase
LRRIYDISQTLRPGIAVWPGDAEFAVEWRWRMSEGGSVNVSTIRLSAHTGSHTDAPYHFFEKGAAVAELPLEKYLGRARVVDLSPVSSVEPEHLGELDLSRIERLLFRTLPGEPDAAFPGPFPYLSAGAARKLGEAGLELVGIDTPSMDPVDSKDLPAHHLLLQHGVAILEGIDLRGVPPGDYELIALPLKLAVLDGSPVPGSPVRRFCGRFSPLWPALREFCSRKESGDRSQESGVRSQKSGVRSQEPSESETAR